MQSLPTIQPSVKFPNFGMYMLPVFPAFPVCPANKYWHVWENVALYERPCRVFGARHGNPQVRSNIIRLLHHYYRSMWLLTLRQYRHNFGGFNIDKINDYDVCHIYIYIYISMYYVHTPVPLQYDWYIYRLLLLIDSYARLARGEHIPVDEGEVGVGASKRRRCK